MKFFTFTLGFAALTRLAFADTATIDFNTAYQRIDGFGGSSAYFGTPWTEAQADLVFSPEKGIGLSLLRVKITANFLGTTAATKMLTSNAETGIAKQAIARGARVWGAPWSPPAQFKSNNNTNGGSFVSANNQDYANMLASYVADMKSAGVSLYALSIQNEPDFVPTSYEGCGWSAQQLHDFVPFLYNSLASRGVSTTRIMLPESDNWQTTSALSAINTTLNDPAVAPMVGIIANHDYAINNQTGSIVTPASIPHTGKALWETEVSTTSAFDGGIANGLYWAKRIHLFMTAAQANAWHCWWFMNYTPAGGEGDNSGLFGQNFAITKRAEVLGQFAKFVRPGYYRIDAGTSGNALISAYKNPADGKFAIVAINNTAADISETFTLSHFQTSSVTPWVTSATEDLAQHDVIAVNGSTFTVNLPANTVTTFVGTDTTTPPAPSTSRLINLSIRTNSGTDDQVLSAGFSVVGGSKKLLVRAVGPALRVFGVTGYLTNPQLEVWQQSPQVKLATNAGWDQVADPDAVRTTAAAVGAFSLTAGAADSALLMTLPEGGYSGIARGANSTTGQALVEVYDADTNPTGRLVNLSARSYVGPGSEVLAAGFVVSDGTPKTLLIRAVGPTLRAFGLGGTIAAPKLTVLRHNSDNTDTEIASNAGWASAEPANIVAAGTAVSAFALTNDSLDSAAIVTVQPGYLYFAQLTGVAGSSGVGLIEIYEVR
jgi:glucuronoarabinoxylan endo-1,4-beta-xylanase